jgi:predicted ATPase
LNEFAKAGYRVVPEAARALIDEGILAGKTVHQIRESDEIFQRRILEFKLKIERELPLDETIFLDRAVPDSIAYYRLCGFDPKEVFAVCMPALYQKVFLFEPLPLIKDYARVESQEIAEKLNVALREAYLELGYEVIEVPVMPVEERTRFILERM